ncbi:hypothetical protein ABDI30_21680 [Paenibacillus cisolokensis]|uniref:hypothetical protein n=1 Tax=Paenibacillus cisolokensis TaxID=1658519 RepID=UPI003D2945D0
MKREDLARQALEAGQAAEHNLQLIAREPGRMNSPEKLVDGIAYLNTMIRFAEEEKKNARRAGRTLGLRTRLKSLLLSILNAERQKRKGVEL